MYRDALLLCWQAEVFHRAKFFGRLMRDYLLLAVSPTLLTQCSSTSTIEGMSMEKCRVGLSLFAHEAAACRAAVHVASIAS